MAQNRTQVERIPVPQCPDDATCIELECNWDVGIGGSLWTSGRLMVDYFCRNPRERQDLAGCSVVELGSGTGLVGLAMALMGPKRVAITDLESHVDSMQRNVARNASRIPSTTNVDIVAVDWYKFTATDAEKLKPVDWIVGTDIAYQSEFYVPLTRALELLAGPKTRILLGLNRLDTDMRFFRMLVDAGFEYYKISDELVDPEYRGKDFGLFDIRKRQQDE